MWEPVFGVGHDDRATWLRFKEAYEPFLKPPNAEDIPPLQPISGDALKAVAAAMRGSAGGVDGWDAFLLSHLPQTGWSRLADVLRLCERSGRWPAVCKIWRLCFIPKTKGDGAHKPTEALQVRPIAVGNMVYRLWGRLRLQEISPSLRNHLAPFQSGGCAGADVESLLVSMSLDFPTDSHQFGLALDFAKAFDSADAYSCVEILKLWGLPPEITGLLENQWLSQVRYATYGGAVHPAPLSNCCSLPQGDAWSPISLAALLAAPLRKMQYEFPSVGQMLYLDDRTILASSIAEAKQVQVAWEEFSNLTRLKTHPRKTQLWGRTPEAKVELERTQDPDTKESGEVLGAVDGPGSEHATELARKESTKIRAKRILTIPGSQLFRQKLASCLLTTHAVWGLLITNRPCHQEYLREFSKMFREAVKGAETRGDRAARALQKVLLLGHMCDLGLNACSRLMNAVQRWARFRLRQGMQIPGIQAPFPRLLQSLNSMLATWGWRATGWGKWSGPSGSFDVRGSKPSCEKAMHALRTDWRLYQVNSWKSMPRLDAVCARSCNLVVNEATLNKLRRVAKKTSVDGIAVMCGGMWSPAVERFGDNRGMVHHCCPYCSDEVVPDLDHIFWRCRAFDGCRSDDVVPPVHPFAKRMGWDDGLNERRCLKLVNQMAGIRQAEVRLRLRVSREMGHS